jgi:outer membrane protein
MYPRPKLTSLALAVLLLPLAGGAAAADLMQAYELARDGDPVLSQIDSQRLATGENVDQTRALLLPQIDGSAGFSISENETTAFALNPDENDGAEFGLATTDTDSRAREYGVSIQQSIYNHANYTQLRATRTRAEAANSEYDAAFQALATRVAQTYFTALTAIDTLAFTRAEERAVKRQLDQAEQRFEVGLTAITDVHEARAQYDGARANAITAQNALDDAREALAEITGEYLTNLQGLAEDFEPVLPEPQDMSAWVNTAIEQNPLLRARALAVDAAGHDISTARAGHLPYLNASLSYGQNVGWGQRNSSLGLSTPNDSESLGGTVSVQLVVPIFAGGAVQSRVRQAVYNRDATADVLEQERRAITRETRGAYRSVLAGISEIEARRQARISAQSALEATEAGFEVGTRTIVDVLLSQRILFQAQRDYSSARHNFLVNNLILKQSAGIIDIRDVAEVNRLLTRDAEAALVFPEDSDPG